MPDDVKTDPFGEPVPAPEVNSTEEIKVEVKPEEKGEEGKDKQTPTQQIAELSRKIGELEALHSTKDENIKAMRDKLKSLEKGGKSEKDEDKGDSMFSEVKFSKDLTQDERDEMTDTEIRLFDESASLKVAMNKMFEAIQKGQGGDKVTDLNSTARAEALALAGGDKDMANQIIEQFNEFNNEGLTLEQVKERVAKASKLVPDFKPAREQEDKKGKPVKGKGSASDPFGVDKIVEEARSGTNGTYSL